MKFTNGKLYQKDGIKYRYIGKNGHVEVFERLSDRAYISFFPEDLGEFTLPPKNGKFTLYIHGDKESTIDNLQKTQMFTKQEIENLRYMVSEVELNFEKRDDNIFLIGIDGISIPEIAWAKEMDVL